MALDPTLAAAWLARWDRQQERYVADREERFAVIGDVLAEALAGRAAPLVVDLGCGPGSLSARLARRLPSAEIVGVDLDPLLLGLARAASPGAIRFAHADLSVPGWTERIGLAGRPVHAAVSTTALHYLPEETLARTYRELGTRMAPDGVFVNADNLTARRPRIAALAAAVRRRRAVRAGTAVNPDWASWWRDVEAEPAFASLVAERKRWIGAGADHEVSADRHAELLAEAGFAETGTVWQSGDDTVLVAVR
ncbi:class I SAM-dependent methyltransferase [Spirillospora sp. NPDC050679]